MSIGISSAAYFTLFCTQAHKLCRKALSLKKGGSPSEQTQSDLQVFQGQISLLRGRLHRAIVPRADMDTHKLTVHSACAMRDLVFFDGTASFSMINGIRSCTVFMILFASLAPISCNINSSPSADMVTHSQDVALHFDAAIILFAHADEQELFSTCVVELCQLVMSAHTLPFYPLHSELSMNELMCGLMEGVRATSHLFSSQLIALETLNLARTTVAAELDESQWVDLDDEVDRRDMQEHETGWCCDMSFDFVFARCLDMCALPD